jgi:nucleoside-diphosphate-sugar epimerase
MKVVLFGYEGKVGAIVAAGLEQAGHEVLGVELGDELPDEGEAAVDFTQPGAAVVKI